MGFTTGRANITVFRTNVECTRNEVMQKLNEWSFRPAPETVAESVGWVDPYCMLNMDLEKSSILPHADYVLVALRVDTKKIPQPLLQAKLKMAIKEYLKEHQLDSIGIEQKRFIKQSIAQELLRDTKPTTKSYQVLWHLQSGKILFEGISDQLCDILRLAFTRTFGQKPHQVTWPMQNMGNHALLWLWHKSESNDGIFHDQLKSVIVAPDDSIRMEVPAASTSDPSKVVKIDRGEPSYSREAAIALQSGKLPTVMRISIVYPGQEEDLILLNILGKSRQFRGVIVPNGDITTRISMLYDVVGTIEAILAVYEHDFQEPQTWEACQRDIEAWIEAKSKSVIE